ncbi:tetratricopeptide repeat protein [Luedemannella helvata]|uniref:Tetratricopeptide repeat protein n=1 Tax=Luedemannella helvata TaxID=349315 RepID=A0ABP4XK29_9ACTN
MDNLLVGKAHGDLSGRNILVPSKPVVQADKFELIDYDHYAEDAPLARDPMHLLVALALDDFEHVRSEGEDLIKVIINPHQAGMSGYARQFQEISRAVHEACAASFPARDLDDLWTPQCLLTLVGVALLRIGRTITAPDPDLARRWCYNLATAATERYCNQYDGTRSLNNPPAVDRPEIVDRYFEQEALTYRLAYGPFGVLSVQGRPGVGKSKLVDTVIRRLGGERRLIRRQTAPGYPLDVHELVELIGGRSADIAGGPGAALVRLESVLAEVREPVVIAIESAEQLLDPDAHRLLDLGMDEAFIMLNSDEDHRVSVVLEGPEGGVLAATESDQEPVRLHGLNFDHFVELLGRIDPGSRLNLKDLSTDECYELWRYSDGIPRIGELLYATVCQANVPLRALLEGLREHPHEPTAYLIRTLIDGMHPLRRKVMRALAVLGVPVPVRAMQETLGEVQPEQVRQSLGNLRADRLLRLESELFFLPGADARVILDQMPEEDRRRLSSAAADALERCAEPVPGNLADLRYHLAQVRALLRAGAFPLALQVMESIDRHLRAWNCTSVLLPYRMAVRGRLDSSALEKNNENELGGIYLALGALEDARGAYDCALTLAGTDAEPKVLARLHANLATVNLQSNYVEKARTGHEDALQRATEADDPIAAMGAMNGLADCHRSRGEYAKAIERATEAFELFRSAGFAALAEADVEGRSLAVGLAVRLSRWHAEQADLVMARKWLEEVRAIAEDTDAWRAAYLDTLADLNLYDGLRTGMVDEVIKTAGRAVDLALKVQDRQTLLQARQTLCVAHLRAGRLAEAAKSISRAGWHRPPGRHLVVLALEALTRRLIHDHDNAKDLFKKLQKEAGDRITKDTGLSVMPGTMVQVGRADFGARHLQGFALCGLVLAGRAEMASAVTSFRMPDVANPPYVPGLVERMVFMLERLDESAPQPGILQPAIDALRGA